MISGKSKQVVAVCPYVCGVCVGLTDYEFSFGLRDFEQAIASALGPGGMVMHRNCHILSGWFCTFWADPGPEACSWECG